MRGNKRSSDSESETDGATSSSSPSSTSSFSSSSSSSSGVPARDNRRSGSLKRKRTSRESDSSLSSSSFSSSSESSDAHIKRRKSRHGREKERKHGHRRDKSVREREKKRSKHTQGKRTNDKHGRREKPRRREAHRRERRKRRSVGVDSVVTKDDVPQSARNSTLQAVNKAQLQQKELVRQNVEIAKARLASGELQRMKDKQMEMQRLYGTVDWREKKKLRAEKSRLERTIAAGKKMASIEERESARMDAFRVALGLPTAEAQRQAEWRAEATRALAAEAVNKDNVSPPVGKAPSRSRKVIGPRLPH